MALIDENDENDDEVGLNGIEGDVLALLAGMEDDDNITNEEGREEEGVRMMMLIETTKGADVGGGVGIGSIASVDKNNSGNRSTQTSTTTNTTKPLLLPPMILPSIHWQHCTHSSIYVHISPRHDRYYPPPRRGVR